MTSGPEAALTVLSQEMSGTSSRCADSDGLSAASESRTSNSGVSLSCHLPPFHNRADPVHVRVGVGLARRDACPGDARIREKARQDLRAQRLLEIEMTAEGDAFNRSPDLVVVHASVQFVTGALRRDHI